MITNWNRNCSLFPVFWFGSVSENQPKIFFSEKMNFFSFWISISYKAPRARVPIDAKKAPRKNFIWKFKNLILQLLRTKPDSRAGRDTKKTKHKTASKYHSKNFRCRRAPWQDSGLIVGNTTNVNKTLSHWLYHCAGSFWNTPFCLCVTMIDKNFSLCRFIFAKLQKNV